MAKVPLPHFLIQGWAHRLARWLVLWVSREMVLGAALAVASVATDIIVGYSVHHDPVIFRVAVGLFLLQTVLVVGLIVAQRRGSMRVREDIIRACLQAIHRDVFRARPYVRLTLFICDPVAQCFRRDAQGRLQREDILVPLFRVDSHSAELRSESYYPVSSTAVTALAWHKGAEAREDMADGNVGALVTVLPHFHTRSEMDQFYIDHLKIERPIVGRIGDHMMAVVEIMSVPFLGSTGRTVGLLSIDFTARTLLTHPQRLASGTISPPFIAERLIGYLMLMGSIVETLFQRG